jgi:hypothetical protein
VKQINHQNGVREFKNRHRRLKQTTASMEGKRMASRSETDNRMTGKQSTASQEPT